MTPVPYAELIARRQNLRDTIMTLSEELNIVELAIRERAAFAQIALPRVQSSGAARMMSEQHSPLPWRKTGWGPALLDAEHREVAVHGVAAEDNIDFIGRTVNAHGALLAQLREVAEYFETLADPSGWGLQILADVKALLAAAE